jgi:peptidoglycan/LPS O-acetylase OafA/YrhL
MPGPRPRPVTRRRALLLAVAALLTASALLAVAILLIGTFGTLQARILGTTALLAGYGVLALPATVLFDQGRARGAAAGLVLACAAAAGLALALVWQDEAPEWTGKSMMTANAVALAGAMIAALLGRRREVEPPLVHALFVASAALAAFAVALFSILMWSESENAGAFRILGVLVVLALLTAALQPILARARGAGVRVRMRISAGSGATQEVSADGRDMAAAVAVGIRRVEASGARITAVEVLERGEAPPG